MRILFLGTGEFGVPTLRALAAGGHSLVAAVSQPDRPAGRGLAVEPTPVHAAANELRIRHVQTADVNALALEELVADAELGFVVAFGQKIGRGLRAALPRGCVNLHGSLLPKLRGAAPVQRAILDGEPITGVTIFQLDDRWDAGPIWSQRETPIGDAETADELHDRLAGIGAALALDTLAAMQRGELRPRAQDESRATRAPKLSKSDGVVDFAQPAARVARRVNGLWSWPAAAAEFVSQSGRSERVLLARARAVDQQAAADAAHPPGTILPVGHIQAAPGRIELLELKPAGGRLMSFQAFANGRRIRPGDRFRTLERP